MFFQSKLIEHHFLIQNIPGSHKTFPLSLEPPKVIENFLPRPTSIADILRAPDGFPDPEYQYTLRELSLLWKMYGGSDFVEGRRDRSEDRREGLGRITHRYKGATHLCLCVRVFITNPNTCGSQTLTSLFVD